MKNILIYGMTGNIGGLENYIMYQFRQFDKTLLHFDFISAYKNVRLAFHDEIINLGSKIFDLTDEAKWKDFLIAHSGQYDTIIFNVTNPLDLYMLQDVKNLGGFKRIIIHSHNGGIDFSPLIQKFLKKRFDERKNEFKAINAELWACSSLAGKWMFGEDAKFTFIRNGIDTETFRYNEKVRKEVRAELGLSDNDFVIGNIARFAIQKNHKFLLKIFKEALKEIPNAKLVLVGQNAPSFSMLKELTTLRATLSGIRKDIMFLGLRKDTARLYQAFDVFVLPSLYEGLPVVGVEAECSGLPCLFSDKITKEAKLIESLEYFPIDNKKDVFLWTDALKKIASSHFDRSSSYLDVKNKGFDIREETARVQDLLLNG